MNEFAGSDDTLPLHIEQLWIYPVKSCAGIRLGSVELLETGLQWDRAWMVVDDTGEFVSQRDLPHMALIRPRLHAGWLELTAPGMLSLQVPLDASGEVRRVRVWDDEVEAWDMGDAAARWFERALALPGGAPRQGLRLVRFDPTVRRLSSLQWTGGVQAPNLFSDGYPVLVLSAAALLELNERLAVRGFPAVGAGRFRPNLVLGGLEAHDEDRLSEIRLLAQVPEDAGVPPHVVLQPVKPCSRCSIPDVDPATAERGSAVSQVLHAYRQDRRLMGAVTFGMNAIVRSGTGQMLHEGMRGLGVWGAWD